MTKLRVGFLLDDLSPSTQVNELIEFVNENDVFQAPIIVTGYRNSVQQSFSQNLLAKVKLGPIKFLDVLVRAFLLRIIALVELKKVRRLFPNYRVNQKIRNLNTFEIIEVQGSWSKSKLFLRMTKADLSLIADANIDCLIRCGSGILRGSVLDVTRLGVISFHHGDNRKNRGGPSGFWEVLYGEPSSGFIIQKLNQELDGGDVLFRGNMMTSNLWFSNHAQLLDKSNVFMKKLLLKIAITGQLPNAEGLRLHSNRLYKLDSSLPLISYVLKVMIPKVFGALVAKLMSPRAQRWSIAYCHDSDLKKSLWRYTEIDNPKGRFLADPFVIEHRGETYIFVEDLFYCDNKGRISVIKVDVDKHDFLGVALEEEFHLSFPFVFKDGQDIYMIPESCNNSDIRLYRCIDFPLSWELETQLMVNVDAADTMLVENEGTWFLLTNLCSAGMGDHQSELHIFYTEDFKNGDWTPIASGNPVIFDPLKSRNGGMFRHSGKLYRVNQIQGQSHYGRGFSINEVVAISKGKYAETAVSVVEPNFKNGVISTHHFHTNEELAVVDFARPQRLKTILKT